MKPRTLPFLGVLLGAAIAFASVAAVGETPQDERFCSSDPSGKIHWCITYLKPGTCGPSAGEHCDEAGNCWCGDADALEWPGDNGSGLPLFGREAAYLHRVKCDTFTFGDLAIGDCGYGGWVCRKKDNWCQDTAGRGWWLTPPPRRPV